LVESASVDIKSPADAVEGETDGDADADGESEADGERLGDFELDGESEADGERLGDFELDGESDGLLEETAPGHAIPTAPELGVLKLSEIVVLNPLWRYALSLVKPIESIFDPSHEIPDGRFPSGAAKLSEIVVLNPLCL
jgi:hypothetical protein